MRIVVAGLVALFLLPGAVNAQGSPMFRVAGTADSWLGDAYDNLGTGTGFAADILFGTASRFGFGVHYSESYIGDEDEALVAGGVDLILMQVSPGGFYFEARGGYESQGFDVTTTRYGYQGFNVGGALGFLQPLGGVWADIALHGGYFSSFAAWANDEELDDSLSGARIGIRLGLALAGGAN